MRYHRFALAALVAVGVLSFSAHAAGATEHASAPSMDCTTFSFDPEPGTVLHVRITFTYDEATSAVVDGNYTTDADRQVRVNVFTYTDNQKGTYTYELPDIFPGAVGGPVPFDCTRTGPPITPPTTQPEPVYPNGGQPPEIVPPVVTEQVNPELPAGSLAYTGAATKGFAILGIGAVVLGAYLVLRTRKHS